MAADRRASGTRPLISSVPWLSISFLDLRGWRYSARQGNAARGGGLTYSRGGPAFGQATFRASIGPESGLLTLECNFSNEAHPTVEQIEIVSVPNTWGGRHWFFRCPVTGKRARKLYRWPGLGFSHREASSIPAVYSCQQDSGQARTVRGMHDIRKRLGGQPGVIEKPAGMPWRTFYRLNRRYMVLQDKFWHPTKVRIEQLSRLI